MFSQQSKLFKALGDPTRLQIIYLLKDEEKCVCDLLKLIPVSQPTLSHHLKVLENSNLLQFRKEGKWVYYSIKDSGKELLEMSINCIINS